MKRSRFPRRSKQSPVTEELIRLASNLSQSNSRLEDGFWESRLSAAVDSALAQSDEESLHAALDHLYGAGERAYDELADMAEYRAETRIYSVRGGGSQDILLFAAPVLAWSRFSIPAGKIDDEAMKNLRVQLQAHVCAAEVRLGLADFLFSPDQLPQSYCMSAVMTEKLAQAALHNRDLDIDAGGLPETMHFLSDTRYLIGALCTSSGSPMFRWQEDDGNRNEVFKQWRIQGGDVLRPLLPGCAIEALLPQSFHAAVRDADRLSRPYSLRSAVAFLQTSLNIPAARLRAVVAPYYDQRIEEYRIGFILDNATEVIHGVVWQLLETEDETAESQGQIEAVLREAGVGEVIQLDHRLPLEYCDDCGVPLYPNAEGEPVHAELPEQIEAEMSRHLH